MGSRGPHGSRTTTMGQGAKGRRHPPSRNPIWVLGPIGGWRRRARHDSWPRAGPTPRSVRPRWAPPARSVRPGWVPPRAAAVDEALGEGSTPTPPSQVELGRGGFPLAQIELDKGNPFPFPKSLHPLDLLYKPHSLSSWILTIRCEISPQELSSSRSNLSPSLPCVGVLSTVCAPVALNSSTAKRCWTPTAVRVRALRGVIRHRLLALALLDQ